MRARRTAEKLIRDRIPAIARAQGRELALRTADSAEMTRLLGLKLIEEAHEVLDAVANGQRSELLDELADLQTVIEAIGHRHGIDRTEIARRVEQRRDSRGGFEQQWVLQLDDRPVRGSPRLHVGGGPSLIDALRREFETCAIARIAVAFVMKSGLDLIEGPALAALLRGAELQILTTDYLGVTEPDALRRLCGWHGRIDARVYSHPRRSYHPKAYLFERADGSGRAFIGSANLSRMGLLEGVEWTWSVLDIDAGQPMHELALRFEELFEARESATLSPEWITQYEARRVTVPAAAEPRTPYGEPPVEPRPVQQLALIELERLRRDGERRALVVAATGLGKTYLAAFDARDARRVLFVAHREELLRQAQQTFGRLYPSRSQGLVADGRADWDRELVFASIQTLSRPERLAELDPQHFDYVVIDEFHHAAANTYQRVLDAVSPRFLLGLTATPFRGDNRDILELCNGNLAYQVGLFEAIAFGWLIPFRYFGIADVVMYDDELLNARRTGYDTIKLTLRFNTASRAALVLERYREHPSSAALGFCVSIEHAQFMADQFQAAGVAAAAVHSGPDSIDRVEAIRRLAQGTLRVLFTVDLFNEGVDIPCVDLVLFLRPTESMTVFLQQLGRGLRLHPGKAHLTVLDFIGNYRNAHVKLPLLTSTDPTVDPDPSRALKLLQRWQLDGIRPDEIPEGVEVRFEPVALDALREALRRASPQRELVVSELKEFAERLGRTPTLADWARHGRYSLRSARTILGVDRWHRVLEAAGLLSDQARVLETLAGDFLKEVETTAMTKSFKMVVLCALCDGPGLRRAVSLGALVRTFRAYYSQERHREDVLGSEVEEALTCPEAQWSRLITSQPINAWIGGNTGRVSPWFAWHAESAELRYIGPWPDGGAGRDDEEEASRVRQALRDAVRERALARLEEYWSRPSPGRMVFPVVVPSRARGAGEALAGADGKRGNERGGGLCIMFGKDRAGLPTGWHLVSINGRHLYGKFVEVALNVVKTEPTDAAQIPNLLSQELRALFGGVLPQRPRVRLVREAGAAVWRVERG